MCEAPGVHNIDLLSADVSSLFLHYSTLYFDDSLGACSVEWSSARMTRWAAAGSCAPSCSSRSGPAPLNLGASCYVQMCRHLPVRPRRWMPNQAVRALAEGRRTVCDAWGSSCGLSATLAIPCRQPGHSPVPVLRAVPPSAGAQRGKCPACAQA